jgi:hypothetical protein
LEKRRRHTDENIKKRKALKRFGNRIRLLEVRKRERRRTIWRNQTTTKTKDDENSKTQKKKSKTKNHREGEAACMWYSFPF